MDSDRFKRIKEIFHAASELEPGERSAFLDKECGADSVLRREVEAMMDFDPGAEALLESLVSKEISAPLPRDRFAGKQIGQYHLKRIISTGGMGTVYEALQEKPRRTVAVKVMKEGIASKSALRRFEYESQILARLRHPGIAQVYEAGTHVLSDTTSPKESVTVPYFVMEYIPNARAITEYVYDKKLKIDERLKLFMQVCEAVHHGHQKGIIHRDLKPANILVDSNGHVKIIDFGVARATDSDLALTTLQTEVGQLIGTLQYMSPEQCQADPHDLDTRSDVYSLGVVLYELLCKKLPYDVRKLSVYEAVQKIRDVQPIRPSTSLHILKGDTETIVLKALEKERERRYQSADELKRDIDRYLKGETIMARPPSVIYQLRTFARRNKALVGGVLAAFIALLTGFIVSLSMYIQAEDARREAAREADAAKAINTFFNDMLASVDPLHLNVVSGFQPEERRIRKSFGAFSRDVSVAEMMRFGTTKIEETFAGKPELEARVRETMGTTLISLGLYTEAMAQLEKALKIREGLPGEDPLETLRAQVQLAYIMKFTEKRDRAIDLLRPAIEKMRRVFGKEHRNTLTCQCMLAAALFMQEKFEEADLLFRNTLEAQIRLLGEEARDVLWTMTEWSYVLYVKLRNKESKDLAQEAYRISLREFGEEDYITLFSGIILAWNLIGIGDYKHTETMSQSIMENASRILGEEHRITMYAKVGYVISLPMEEDLQEKESLLKAALATCRESLGEGHFWTLRTVETVADYLASTGKFDEVENLYRQRLKCCQEELGEGAPETIYAMKVLADCLLNQGRLHEGSIDYKAWVELIAKSFGDRHDWTIAAMAYAAESLWYAGMDETAHAYASRALTGWKYRVERAEADAMDFNGYADLLLTCEPPELRDPARALELAKKANEKCGNEDPNILDTLALAYHLTGNTEQALETQKRAIDLLPSAAEQRQPMEDQLVLYLLCTGDFEAVEQILAERATVRQARLGEGNLFLADHLLEEALLLIEGCRYEMAEPRLQESLTLFNKSHWPNCIWMKQIAKSVLGQCLAHQGSFDEAEVLLLESYEGINNHPMVSLKDQQKALERIIKLYEVWGRPDEVEKWRMKIRKTQ